MPSIRLNKRTNTIKIVNRKKSIKLTKDVSRINLKHFGKPGGAGDTGPQGEPGKGLPAGGTVGQIPVKSGSVDYEVSWQQPGVTDKNFIHYFTSQADFQVEHGLNKYPSVTIVDSAGDEVEGGVDYLNANAVRVTFGYPTSGFVTFN